ncbi:branched-chain amino acid ABC transporter permease [uncultured Dysosmobacter sp.]|uniref:branched-chain amino acid ABC transporter permease n=1 Tax=uncultured Dysosmobacter sp. TaxID=2591384 RepID=UPI002624390B|nr:branched-chain amino acid ABC transporter permease [uncultured Dysosmobacter sp.]
MMKTKNNSAKTLLMGLVVIAVLAVLSVGAEAIANSASSLSIMLAVLKKATVYALLAVSMNLLNGFTGLFSLGQAGFMLVGAYTYAILTIPAAKRAGVYQYYDGGVVKFSIPEVFSGVLGESIGPVVGMVLTLVICGLLAAFFGWLIGLPVLRLKSDYLAIATLGFAEIMRTFIQFEGFAPLTNGSNTLRQYTTFKHLYPYVIVVGICILILVLLINSTYGRAFKAIRDDEIAAEAMGINLAKHKMMSFVISSFFAGVGGGLMAMYMSSVQAKGFTSAMTYEILLMVVIGGIGSISGSIIASFLFIGCSEWWLRFLDDPANNIGGLSLLAPGFRMVVFSVFIMIVVLFFRRGLMGDKEFPDLFRRGKRQKKGAAGK